MFMFPTLPTENGPPQNNRNLSPHFLEALIRRIAEEDLSAFEILYRSTDTTLYAYILSIIGNPHDAQDIMQDAYLKIRSGAHLYTPLGKPLAWIFTIAKNLAYMKLRSVRENPTADPDALGLSGQSVLTDEGLLEDSMILREALQILSAEEREILFLHAISGFKHREIAAALGLPLSTVLSKYMRSLAKLKKHLIKMGVIL